MRVVQGSFKCHLNAGVVVDDKDARDRVQRDGPTLNDQRNATRHARVFPTHDVLPAESRFPDVRHRRCRHGRAPTGQPAAALLPGERPCHPAGEARRQFHPARDTQKS